MKIRPKTRAEQDYWLSYCDKPGFTAVTEEERQEFHLFDSQGKPCPIENPIRWGKMRHGQYVAVVRLFDRLSKKEGWWVAACAGYEDMDERLLKSAFGERGAEARALMGLALSDEDEEAKDDPEGRTGRA